MSKRILLRVAYDGTGFAGFQYQPGDVRTIEGELNAALKELTGEEISVIGGSRTDAGVHALCNVAVFDTESRIPADRFSYALNIRLPEQIKVQESVQVADDFHPRHCDTVKTYEYRIYNAAQPLPQRRLDCFYTYFKLDLERMRRAAAYLVGEHDFTSFCSIYAQSENHVRTITAIEIEERDPITCAVREDTGLMPRQIVIRVSGTGFLYNMVRIIAGTLMEVGRGAKDPDSIGDVLAAMERRLAGPTAPACGLTLVSYKFM